MHDNTVLMVLAIIAVVLISAYVPILGLIAIAWASYMWLGVYAAIILTIVLASGWHYFGPGLIPAWWFQRPPTAPPAA